MRLTKDEYRRLVRTEEQRSWLCEKCSEWMSWGSGHGMDMTWGLSSIAGIFVGGVVGGATGGSVLLAVLSGALAWFLCAGIAASLHYAKAYDTLLKLRSRVYLESHHDDEVSRAVEQVENQLGCIEAASKNDGQAFLLAAQSLHAALQQQLELLGMCKVGNSAKVADLRESILSTCRTFGELYETAMAADPGYRCDVQVQQAIVEALGTIRAHQQVMEETEPARKAQLRAMGQ